MPSYQVNLACGAEVCIEARDGLSAIAQAEWLDTELTDIFHHAECGDEDCREFLRHAYLTEFAW
jgi:hypothetical protein